MAYYSRDNAEQVYGVTAIRDWANLERGDVTDESVLADITARINTIGAWVDAEIDEHAIQANYQIPLVNSSGATPATIQHLAAVLLGVWLYEAMGNFDIDPNTKQVVHRFVFREQWARQVLEEIKSGDRKVDAAPYCRT